MDNRHRVNYSANHCEVRLIKPVLRRNVERSQASSAAQEFVQKVKEAIAEFGVIMVQIEDWIILRRSKFDIIVNDEPYSALHLYLNVKTHVFITRVWGRTHSKGDIFLRKAKEKCDISETTEIKELCRQTFSEGLVCCPGHMEANTGSGQDNLLIVNKSFP